MQTTWMLLIFIPVWSLGVTGKPTFTKRLRRNAYREKSRLWPQGIVPYSLDEAYTFRERKVIESAMQDIHSLSCIRFVQESGEKVYVSIVRGKGCRAVVGYIGRKQKLILGNGCIWKARVLHELMHVLGFFHEHARPDRDDYIIVHAKNIRSSALGNFRKMHTSKVTTFQLPYDYSSVLHYHDRAFAIDRNNRTLEPRKEGAKIGASSSMSSLDVMKLNMLYECNNKDKDEGSGDNEIEENFIIV